jgi:hypothetical protein
VIVDVPTADDDVVLPILDDIAAFV